MIHVYEAQNAVHFQKKKRKKEATSDKKQEMGGQEVIAHTFHESLGGLQRVDMILYSFRY